KKYGAPTSCLLDLVGSLAPGRGRKTAAHRENQGYTPNRLALPGGPTQLCCTSTPPDLVRVETLWIPTRSMLFGGLVTAACDLPLDASLATGTPTCHWQRIFTSARRAISPSAGMCLTLSTTRAWAFRTTLGVCLLMPT